MVVGAIAVGSVLGAQVGARVGRKMPPLLYRVVIVCVGVAAIIAMLHELVVKRNHWCGARASGPDGQREHFRTGQIGRRRTRDDDLAAADAAADHDPVQRGDRLVDQDRPAVGQARPG